MKIGGVCYNVVQNLHWCHTNLHFHRGRIMDGNRAWEEEKLNISIKVGEGGNSRALDIPRYIEDQSRG